MSAGAAGPADAFYKLFGVWEKEAARVSGAMSRNAKVLAFGAGMMRAQLLAGRAAGLFLEASLAPWQALLGAGAGHGAGK